MRNLLLLLFLPLFGVGVTVKTPAWWGSTPLSATYPNHLVLKCTYYQPLAKYDEPVSTGLARDMTFAGGYWSSSFNRMYHWVPLGAAVTGGDAYAAGPLWRAAYGAGHETTIIRLDGSGMSDDTSSSYALGPSYALLKYDAVSGEGDAWLTLDWAPNLATGGGGLRQFQQGSAFGASHPPAAFMCFAHSFAYWGGTTSLVEPHFWYPYPQQATDPPFLAGFRYGDGPCSARDGSVWPYTDRGSRCTFDGTVLNIYVDPLVCRAYSVSGAFLPATQGFQFVNHASQELPSSSEFLWLRLELAEDGAGLVGDGGMSDDCCLAIIAHLDSVITAINTQGSLVREDLAVWKSLWSSQDTFLRTKLSAILEALSPSTAPSVPTLSDYGARALSGTPTAASVFDSVREVAPSLSVPPAGVAADDTTAPTFSITLPRNPLASVGLGADLGTIPFALDFAPFSSFMPLLWAFEIAAVGLVMVHMVWNELRRY